MDFLKNRRTVLALAGAAVALLAGLAFAWTLVSGHRGEVAPPPPASQAGLVIDSADLPDARMDPTKPLRCFVAGQPVGELTLAECAKRNGVATDALDVGLDRSGALAADTPGAALTPLPTPASQGAEPPVRDVPAAAPPLPQVVGTGPGACWRYADGQWRRLTPDMSLGVCAQTLFGSRCVRVGEAAYGRWGQQTLRLVPGWVEISSDNHNFRQLFDQQGCGPNGAG